MGTFHMSNTRLRRYRNACWDVAMVIVRNNMNEEFWFPVNSIVHQGDKIFSAAEAARGR